MQPADVSLEDALKLLSLPRVVGHDADGTPITAQIGRFGAYVTRGTDSRSLESDEAVFTVTTDEALALFAQPKTRQRRAATEPLKVLAEDSVSKKVIKVMQGRFGVYVTDGETNASLRREDALETLTQERAEELLQMRRDRDPDAAKGRGRRGKKPAPKGGKAATDGAKSEGASAKSAAKGVKKKANGATAKARPASSGAVPPKTSKPSGEGAKGKKDGAASKSGATASKKPAPKAKGSKSSSAKARD
jgi:DNA topoisomerase-1